MGLLLEVVGDAYDLKGLIDVNNIVRKLSHFLHKMARQDNDVAYCTISTLFPAEVSSCPPGYGALVPSSEVSLKALDLYSA